MSKITISVRSHIKIEDIENLLYSAAQGTHYWSTNGLDYESEVKKAVHPKNSGAKVRDIEADEPVTYILNLTMIKKGLTVMAKKQPAEFADFIKGNYDMTTGDVFLQCCLFGEVIYG